MDVSSFLSGKFLTHLDLPQPLQIWTISRVDQRLVGSDEKVCVSFAEFPAKCLGLNKCNLRRIAELHGLDAAVWVGKQLLVYRTKTDYAGKVVPCVRLCSPQESPPDAVCDTLGNAVPIAAPQRPYAPAPVQQPVAAPQHQPVAAPQASPWEVDQQQNSPPSA